MYIASIVTATLHGLTGFVFCDYTRHHFRLFWLGFLLGGTIQQLREMETTENPREKKMSCNNDYNNQMWDWQGQDSCVEDNTNIEVSDCLLSGVNQNEDHLSFMLDVATTPVRACGDLVYHVTEQGKVKGREFEQYSEQPTSQAKRRRMLQFESEVLEAPFFDDEMFLRSKETPESLEDAISEMSQWVAGFAEGTSASDNEYLDPSSEGWIADCVNDADFHFSTEDKDMSASEVSDVQFDITEVRNTPPEYDANAIEKPSIHACRNVVFKGRKSYMRAPPTLASFVVYPFTFIKPCGVHGDATLKDINQWIHNPPKSKQNEQDPSYLMSAFSGKPVVGKTKVRTEGGAGSITIVRTRG